MIEKQAPDQLRFRLETDGIEAKALVRILQDTHLTFREIGIANETPETELKIYPFRQGSFEYAIAVVAGLNTAVAALGVFREILSYKKAKLEYLKAKLINDFEEKPKEIAKPEVPAIVQNNPAINIYINGMLKTIGDHSKGFSLTDSATDDIGLHFSDHDIRRVLASERDHKDAPDRQTVEFANAKLSLKVISDRKYGKWGFVYDGVRINAEVPKALKRGAKFNHYKPGTTFYVTLSIRQEYNEVAKAWENVHYRVTEVHKIETV